MKAAANEKRGRPRDESLWASRTDEILDAAATIFAEHGYQHTEMQNIADALSVGKGTIYRYFPSKEDLFLKAVMRGMQRMTQAIEASSEACTDPLERIRRAISAYLVFFRNHPQYAELLIQERAQFKDRKQQTYFVQRENNMAPWREMYGDLIAAGRVRDLPVPVLLDVVSDLVYGTMFTNYFSGRHKSLETQTNDLVDILFHGILTDSERQRRLPAAVTVPGCNANGTTEPPQIDSIIS